MEERERWSGESRMRLGGVTVQVTPNGNLGRGFGEVGGMPAGAMAPPRPIPRGPRGIRFTLHGLDQPRAVVPDRVNFR